MRRAWFTILVIGFWSACDSASAPARLLLDVSPDSLLMFRDEVVQLTATLLDADGYPVTGIALSFESADTAIAKVSGTGLVHSTFSVGRTTIRVSGGGAITNVSVHVRAIPSGILITPTDTLIRTGATVQYRAVVIDEIRDTMRDALVSWHSSDTTIATVTNTGLATARTNAGVTFVSAQAGSLVGPARLRVGIPGVATVIAVTPSDTSIPLGASLQLTTSGRDAFGDSVPDLSVTWSSESTIVATVSNGGLVHSEGPTGTAIIRATSGSTSGIAVVTALDSALVVRSFVSGNPIAAAISVANVAYVAKGTPTLEPGTVVRANLPSRSFGQSLPVGNFPTEIAFNSLGTRAYVSNQYGASVSVIDVAANAQIDLIDVGFRPVAVIVAPGDSILWLGKENSVDAIRLATKQVVTSFPFHGAIANAAVIARDTLLYVSMFNAGLVVEFNLRTTTMGRTFSVGGSPQRLAVSLDGRELYIANRNGWVQFWDLVTGSQVDSILPVPTDVSGIARRPSNGLLYVTSDYSGGRLYVIDPVTHRLVYSAVIGGVARGVVFNSDGGIGIIPNERGWVDFIN